MPAEVPFAGGGASVDISHSFHASPPLGHPISQVLSYWLDNHMFVAATLIGFTVMQRYPNMKVVVAHGKASWMEEVLEKMEASTRTIPLLHHYPVRTDVEEMWEEGKVMLGFDAEERLILKLPEDFAEKDRVGLALSASGYHQRMGRDRKDERGECRRIDHRAHAGYQRCRATWVSS